MSQEATLLAGIQAMELTLPDGVPAQLLRYLALLAKWNKVYNLTAIRNAEEMLTHHLLDALAVLPVLSTYLPKGSALADVGSGGGLPAIVLALARPDWQICSIEAVQKKASFQQQAKIELGLENLTVRCDRVEKVSGCFQGVISRAFASLPEFVQLTAHLKDTGGHWFAMKGVYPEAELSALPNAVHCTATHTLSVPGLNAARCLIILESD